MFLFLKYLGAHFDVTHPQNLDTVFFFLILKAFYLNNYFLQKAILNENSFNMV